MKRLGVIIGSAILVLFGVLVVRASLTKSVQKTVAPKEHIQLDTAALAQRLSQAIQIPTISKQEATEADIESFRQFHALLERNYPKTFATLSKELVNQGSLVLHWPGTDSTLKPVLFLGHQDVVPVEEESLQQWEQPPFSGAIVDGFIWGRGSLDFKFGVVGWLEAVEHLLTENFTPKRSIYFAFGHDEEIGGHHGAKIIADNFASRGIQFEFVLDEGLPITKNIMPGLPKPLALIGVAEKGYVTLELTVKGEGGHSSMPPPHTTVGLLAEAITRLENNPMPARIAGPTQALFDTVGPEFPVAQRLVFANLWLLKNVVLGKLGAKPGTNALIRTTLAATMFQGSVKENVLPTKARALVNSRILPGDTMESVEAHAKSVINMTEVSIKSLAKWGQNPSPASCIDCESYDLISKTIHEIYPDTLVAPSTVVGATDARYYQQVSDRVYRFAPQLVLPEDRIRFHGINERVHLTHYANAIRFYRQLILNVN